MPVIKDLIVDRSAFDRIQHAGGFISVNTSGNSQDANAIPIWSQTRHSLHGIGKDAILPVITVPITFAEAIRLDRSIT